MVFPTDKLLSYIYRLIVLISYVLMAMLIMSINVIMRLCAEGDEMVILDEWAEGADMVILYYLSSDG